MTDENPTEQYALVDAIGTQLKPFCKIEGDPLHSNVETTFYVRTGDLLAHIDQSFCWDLAIEELLLKGKQVPFDEVSRLTKGRNASETDQRCERLHQSTEIQENAISFYPNSSNTHYRNRVRSSAEPVRVSLNSDHPEKDQFYSKESLITALKNQDWTQKPYPYENQYYPPESPPAPVRTPAEHLEVITLLVDPLTATPKGATRRIYLTEFLESSGKSENNSIIETDPHLVLSFRNNKIYGNLGEKIMKTAEVPEVRHPEARVQMER